MVRIFIAIDLEDPLLLSRIVRMRDAVVATGVPMKPVETENLHITLRFIGEVPLGTVDAVKDVLSTLSFDEFRIVLHGLGAFPSPARPRVVWVGVSEGWEELRRIRDTIEKGLRSIGIPGERQDFHPHITLARIKGSRGISKLVRLLEEYSDYDFGETVVRSVRLKKSTLTRRGPIYETLMEVKAR